MKLDGAKLKDEIARRQFTITGFAKSANVSAATVYRAMSGGRTNTKTVGKIAAALGCQNPSDLYAEQNRDFGLTTT